LFCGFRDLLGKCDQYDRTQDSFNAVCPSVLFSSVISTEEEKTEKRKKRVLMSSGGIGYALYIGSLWCLAEGGPDGFVIASGAILGTTAALLCKSQYVFHQNVKQMS
jgi:hypothetical protein